MKIFVCVDDCMGTFFNKRRQSMDAAVRSFILSECKKEKLWMNAYSAKQFSSFGETPVSVDEHFLEKADFDDFCFVEGSLLAPFAEKTDKIYLIRWNRSYPADRFFDLSFENGSYFLKRQQEFTGSSHERITVEEYEK